MAGINNNLRRSIDAVVNANRDDRAAARAALEDAIEEAQQAATAAAAAAATNAATAAAQQVAAAIQPNNAAVMMRRAIEVPVFTGDFQKDKITASEFIARANEAQQVGNVQDDNMLQYIKLRLQGKAWTWIENGTEANTNWATQWPEFKIEFCRRWAESSTVSEKVLLRKSLYQKTQEGVQDFYDRVIHAENVLQRENPNKNQAGYRTMFDSNCLFNFLSGLKPEIHERVIAIGCDTLAIALANSIRAEKALFDTKKKKDGLTSAIEQIEEAAKTTLEPEQFQNLSQTLSSMKIYERGGRGRGRGRGRGFGRGGQQGYQGQTYRGRGGYNRGRGNYNNGPFRGQCYRCDEFGHRAQDCPKRGTQGQGQGQVLASSNGNGQDAFAIEQDLNNLAPVWTTVTRQ